MKLTDLARLDNIQYRAGKIVTGASHLTNKEKLNLELGWENIFKRGEILSLCFFHKIHLDETRPLIKTCMPKVNLITNTRANFGYIPPKYKGAKFEKFFFSKYSKTLDKFAKKYPGKKFIRFQNGN